MMRGCGRTFCPYCREEMIHRDHRHGHEAASAFNQILHREGPKNLAAGDIDNYTDKWIGDVHALRILEHKQPDQALGRAQAQALAALDEAIRCAAARSSGWTSPSLVSRDNKAGELKLHNTSGVYVIRGHLQPATLGEDRDLFASPLLEERNRLIVRLREIDRILEPRALKVDFRTKQTVERLDGTKVLDPRGPEELWDWLNMGSGWTSRDGRGRWWT